MAISRDLTIIDEIQLNLIMTVDESRIFLNE